MKAALASLDEDNLTAAEVGVSSGKVSITYVMGDVWDEKGALKDSAEKATDIFEEVFSDPGVTEVEVIATQAFTDQYGKSTQEKATEILWNRSVHEQVEYASFRDLGWKNPYLVATYYYMHPGIWKMLEGDDQIPVEGMN